jgi:hypothetical protein
MNPINKWANGLNDFIKKQTKKWPIKNEEMFNVETYWL